MKPTTMLNIRMNKFLIFVLFIVFTPYFAQTNGSVGINTQTPNPNTVLHIVSGGNNKGILLPQLTETQKNAMVINPATDDGLMIYNTTEDCYNYWSLTDNGWRSVCGQMGKSVFTIDCTNSQAVGTYIQGTTLTSSNYLSVTVNVTKKGTYVISGTTTNGYNFYGSGVFLNTGIQTVQIPGQGTPAAVQADTVQLSANGTNVTCSPAVTINVLSSSAAYTVSCGKATVNGVYTKGTALTGANTITLPVTVTTLGSYSITTNTVDGISFSGSGTFSATGSQNVTLSGSGTPTSSVDKVMTVTSNSSGGVSTCNITVVMTISVKAVLHIGYETTLGYSAYTGPSRSLMDSPTNFGTSATSIVKSAGYTHVSLANAPTDIALQTALNNNPDLVIIGYDATITTNGAGYLLNYLNKKGVVIAFTDRTDPTSSLNLLAAVTSNPGLVVNYAGPAGTVYSLTNVNSPVLNGPFGDVRGKNWGEDASSTVSVANATDITAFSYAQGINDPSAKPSGITGFKHNSLNFIWFGDGGFLSNGNANGNEVVSNTIEPFVAPSSGGYFPVQKSAYGYAGNGYAAGSMQVQNSIVFANALAWGIKQAETNGINTP